MKFNPLFFSSMALLSSASRSRRLHQLDIQNAFKFANWMFEGYKKKKSEAKLEEDFVLDVCDTLTWADILGDGFSAWHPDKIYKYAIKYENEKRHKLIKFIIKEYECEDEKEVNEITEELLDAIGKYIGYAQCMWENKLEKDLTKLDKDYYKYAQEELDAMLESNHE